MPTPRRTQALTCRHGKYRWTDWQIIAIPGGYGVRARCDLGDHWLSLGIAPEPAVVSLQQPFAWVTQDEAERALRQWEAQHEHQEERP